MSNQAVWFTAAGQPFEVGPAEMSSPGPGEVLVRNKAIAINPADHKVQDTGYMVATWPAVLGIDIAGEVVEVGSDVKTLQRGDRVFGMAAALKTGQSKHGGFQQYTVLDSRYTARLPDNISFAEGAVLPCAVSTVADAFYGSREEGYLGIEQPSLEPKSSSGSILVVYGASSSVGVSAVQLAVASGVTVIGVASAKNFDFVRGAGAGQVFDYNDSSFVDKVVAAVQKSGLEYVGVLDAIGTAGESELIAGTLAKRLGGNLASVFTVPEDLPATVKTHRIFAMSAAPYPLFASFLTPALEKGTLKCLPAPIVVGHGLEAIQQAVLDKKNNSKGVSASKLVVEL